MDSILCRQFAQALDAFESLSSYLGLEGRIMTFTGHGFSSPIPKNRAMGLNMSGGLNFGEYRSYLGLEGRIMTFTGHGFSSPIPKNRAMGLNMSGGLNFGEYRTAGGLISQSTISYKYNY